MVGSPAVVTLKYYSIIRLNFDTLPTFFDALNNNKQLLYLIMHLFLES